MRETPRVVVLLDTSVIEGDFKIRQQGLLFLVRACRLAHIPILVPAVVLIELVAHFREQLPKVAEDARARIKKLGRYIDEELVPTLSADIDSICTEYEEYLRRRLDDLGIVVVLHPTIGHDELIKRATAKRKPFKPSGAGYKDALIWETATESLEAGTETLLLVTADRDFSQSGQLHPELYEDVRAVGRDPN